MRVFNSLYTFAAVLTFITSSAYGDADLTEADALFARRSQGSEATKAARTAYENALPQLSNQNLVYAVSRMAQLDVYAGEILLPKSAKDQRRAIFERCHDELLPKIKPEVVGETAQYFYWSGTCLAFWAEAMNPIERAFKVPALKRALNGGFAQDTRYYGGGIKRLAAAVWSNPGARPVGLYKPEEALVKINEALASEAYPGDSNQGSSYYTNYKYKVTVLKELGRRAEALAVATTAISEIEELETANSLPAQLEPETLFELANLRDLKASLGE